MDALGGMLQKLGLSPERLRVDYVSSAEGEKFVNIVKEMSGQLKELGKEKILAENAKLRPTLENMLKRKAAASAPAAKPADKARQSRQRICSLAFTVRRGYDAGACYLPGSTQYAH